LFAVTQPTALKQTYIINHILSTDCVNASQVNTFWSKTDQHLTFGLKIHINKLFDSHCGLFTCYLRPELRLDVLNDNPVKSIAFMLSSPQTLRWLRLARHTSYMSNTAIASQCDGYYINIHFLTKATLATHSQTIHHDWPILLNH